MDVDFRDALAAGHFQQGQQVIHRTVGAVEGDDAQQVQPGAVSQRALHGPAEGLILIERTAFQGLVNAHPVGGHHAPGTDMQVPGLRVAHGSLGHPHGRSGGSQAGTGPCRQETIHHRRARLGDQVARAAVADTPAIEDEEQYPLPLSHFPLCGSCGGPPVSPGDDQALPGHGIWVAQAQQLQNGRSDVGQSSPLAQGNAGALVRIDQDAGDGAVGVAGVDGPIGVIPALNRAMVSRQKGGHSRSAGGLDDASSLGVHRLHGDPNGSGIFDVTDDIDIAQVHGHQGVARIAKGLDGCVCHGSRAHRRGHLGVNGRPGRVDDHPHLSGERLLDLAVEKEAHMNGLL